MKKFFTAIFILIFLFLCISLLNASEYTDTVLPGKWNIHGTGFAEKGFVRLSLEVDGNAIQTTDFVKNLSASVDKILDDNQEVLRNAVNPERKVLTNCNVDLTLRITGAGIKAWNENIPNAVKIPVLLPEIRPTINNPFALPSVTLNNIKYTVTFTSETSGKLRGQGYVDVDLVGTCEINADCALWKDGTKAPATDEETHSGCNSGIGIFTAFTALLIIGIGRGTKFCSGRI